MVPFPALQGTPAGTFGADNMGQLLPTEQRPAHGLQAVQDGAMTTPGVEESWERFTRWLAREAPQSHGCLNPPADLSDIAEAESGARILFPEDLKTVLLINNGAAHFIEGVFRPEAGFLPGGHRLLSAAEIVEQRKMLNGILANTDQEMVGWWWHPEWLPFAVHVAADALAIDLRDGPDRGAIGEFMHESNTNFDWGPSLAAVIDTVAVSVETGTNFKYFHPQVVHGCLNWDVIISPPKQDT
jgi:cell wall assembly regulator SMI1